MRKRPAAGPKGETQGEASASERAAALARLIAYARDEALMLNAQFVAYCLEASLTAAQENLSTVEAMQDDIAASAHPGSDVFGLSQLH